MAESKHAVELTPLVPDIVIMSDLKVGEYGLITEANHSYQNHVVVCCYFSEAKKQVVSLNNPGSTWGGYCPIRVRRLEPGEVIKIMVGN